jgi:putative hydrolases of HD superfamily
MELWEEFEERNTAEARFAAALDRPELLMQNCHNEEGAWHEFGLSRNEVSDKQTIVEQGSKRLWESTFLRRGKGLLPERKNDTGS